MNTLKNPSAQRLDTIEPFKATITEPTHGGKEFHAIKANVSKDITCKSVCDGGDHASSYISYQACRISGTRPAAYLGVEKLQST